MNNLLRLTAIVLATLCAAPSAFAATLLADYSGVTGLEVGGKTYDVTFVDDNCINLFDGCDAPEDFAFSSSTDALAAADALLALVDSVSPYLFPGCANTTICTTFIPYAVNGSGTVSAAAAYNESFDPASSTYLTTLSSSVNASDEGDLDYGANYAIFTDVTPVPLPAGGILLLTGAVALAGVKRRKARNAQAA